MAEEWKNKGNSEFQKGNYQLAIEYYTYACEIEPKNHTYLTNRAAAYAGTKQWEKCLRDAEKSITLKDDWTKGWFRKAQSLQELGRYQEATGAFKKAAGLDPTNADMEKKAKECERMWKKDLSNAELIKEEGNDYFKVGKMQQAIDCYTKAIASCGVSEKDLKTKASCYNNRAHCYTQLYDHKRVVEDCTECLAIEPGNLKALLRRGFAYEGLERMKLALADFNAVLAIDPSVSKAHQAAHRIKQALKAFEK